MIKNAKTNTPIELNFALQREKLKLEVDLSLPGKGATAIFGPSGAGKTTLLRCIAGLEKPKGFLRVNGEIWQDEAYSISSHKRPIAYVFQENRLFPHLNVRGNLDFALKRAHHHASISFDDVIEILALDRLLSRSVKHLSGGEAQRVSIARAVLMSPALLLMDEPLASLGEQSKKEILPYLQTLCRSLSLPILYVSHNVDEISRLANHLVVMEEGRCIMSGDLQETLSRLPMSINLEAEPGVILDGDITELDSQWGLVKASFVGGEFWLPTAQMVVGQKVRLLVLARDISLSLAPNQNSTITNILACIIDDISDDAIAGLMVVRVHVASTPFLIKVTAQSCARLQLKAGLKLWMQIKSVAIID